MNKPGIQNDEFFTHQQYYGGRVEAAAALENGVIADADLLSIETQILNSAYLHSKSNAVDGCFVNLRRAYIVNDADNTDASGFTVTLE